MNIKKTTIDIIKEFKTIHNDKYDYSSVKYVNAKTKVIIKCHVHGVFNQIPNSHIHGRGCPECSKKKRGLSKRNKLIDIIQRFKKAHGELYDYSLVRYTGYKKNVKIICKTHGTFNQRPSHHSSGSGCPKCGSESTASKKFKSNSYFITKSKSIHGDRYDYSLVDYVTAKTNVTIICKEHGIFEQVPNKHTSGQGCPLCGIKKLKEKYTGWTTTNWEKSAKVSKNFDSFKVYVIKCWNNEEEFYKIGRTYTTVHRRFNSLLPYSYEILHEFIFETAEEAFDYENQLQREHKYLKYLPSIAFKGRQECFSEINPDIHTTRCRLKSAL